MKLFSTVNRFPDRQGNPVTFEELCAALAHGDFSSLLSCGLRAQDLEHLEATLLRHIYQMGRLRQVQRARRHLLQALKIKSGEQFAQKIELYTEKIELCLDEVQARRAYAPDTISLAKLRRFALFECLTHRLIWPQQVKFLENDLKGVVKELLMSFGKTSFGIPYLNAEDADGTNIVIDAWPNALAPTNIVQVAELNERVYNQLSNVLTMSRSDVLTAERCFALNVVLQRIQNEKQILHLTQNHAQALDLRFFLNLYNLGHNRYKGDLAKDYRAVTEGLRDFLWALRTRGVLKADEAAEHFYPYLELNYPIGNHSTIDEDLVEVTDLCAMALINCPMSANTSSATRWINSREKPMTRPF